jgi:hypothetical protein
MNFQPGEVVTVEITRDMRRLAAGRLRGVTSLLGYYVGDYPPDLGVVGVQYPLHLHGSWFRIPKINIKRHPG